MKFLELKCPPPVVMILSALFAFFIAQRDLSFIQQQFNQADSVFWPLLFLFAGVACAISGIKEFKQHKTTVNPLNPDKATSLVNSGIFQFTRNPMYLGMLVVLLGWADLLDTILAYGGALTFFLYITVFQIWPEELAMKRQFGDSFDQYCSEVRRWL